MISMAEDFILGDEVHYISTYIPETMHALSDDKDFTMRSENQALAWMLGKRKRSLIGT